MNVPVARLAQTDTTIVEGSTDHLDNDDLSRTQCADATRDAHTDMGNLFPCLSNDSARSKESESDHLFRASKVAQRYIHVFKCAMKTECTDVCFELCFRFDGITVARDVEIPLPLWLDAVCLSYAHSTLQQARVETLWINSKLHLHRRRACLSCWFTALLASVATVFGLIR